jgi:plasmid stabilization system protein ParE
MAYRIFWSPIAVQDLRDICDFTSRDNLVAAQRMGEELIKQSEAPCITRVALENCTGS